LDADKTLETNSRVFLCAEFLLLFGGVPLLILLVRRPGLLFLALWLGGFLTYRASRPALAPPAPTLRAIMHRLAWFTPFFAGLFLMAVAPAADAAERAQARETGRILRHFIIFGAAITLATRLARPGTFLDLPRQQPILWAVIMVLYPLLSVWPQEVIFRRFLFHRYAPLFCNRFALIAASAAAFGFAHIIFLNWIAIAMTAVGGAMFAARYARHKSLGLCCLEHSLYGCLVFTIGLGQFFYTGTAWHH
jgi:membrane protease YdiL (CAAX protease family)